MRGWLRRVARGLGVLLLGLLGVVVVAALVLIGWLRTPSGNAEILARLLPLVAPDHGTLTVEGLETDLFSRLALRGVELADAEGRVLIRVEHLEAAYAVGGLPGRRLEVSSLTASGLRVDLVAPDGPECRDIAALWDPSGAPDTPWTGIGLDLYVAQVHLEGERVALCAGDTVVRVGAPVVDGGLSLKGPVLRWEGVVASGELQEPAPPGPRPLGIASTGSWDGHTVELNPARVALGTAVLGARGAIGLDGDGRLALEVDAGPVEPASLGATGVLGSWTARGPLTGTFSTPTVALQVVGTGGTLELAGGLRIADTMRWEAQLVTRDLELGAVSADAPPMDLSGRVMASGTGLSWPDGLDAHVTVELASARGPDGAGATRLAAEVDVADGIVRVGSATLSTRAGEAAISGELDPTAGTWTARVERSQVRLGALAAWGVPGLAGRVAFRGEASGEFGLLGARATGTLEATGVEQRPDGARVEALSARVDLEWTDAGPVGTVEGSLQALEVAGQRADRGSFRVAAAGQRYSGEVSLRNAGADGGEGWELLGVEGAVDLGRSEVAIRRLHVEPSAGTAWDNLGPVALSWTADGVDDLRLGLVSGPSRVQVDGAFHMEGRHDLRVRVEELDLAKLGALVPAMAGVSGLVGGEARLVGAADDPTLSLDLHGSGLGAPELVRSLGVEASVRAGEGLARATLDAPGPDAAGPLRVELAVPYTIVDGLPVLSETAPLAGRVLLAPGELGDWSAVVARPGLTLPAARLGAELSLGGTVIEPTVGVVATAELPVEGEFVVVDLDARVEADALDARVVTRLGGQQRAQLTGGAAVDLRGLVGLDEVAEPIGELAFDLVPLQLPVAALGPFVDLPEGLEGAVVGGLHVGGRLDAPTVQGGLMLLDARVGDLAVSPALLTLLPTDAGYAVELDLGFVDGGRLHLVGTVPFEAGLADAESVLAREGLDLRLEEGSVPVAALLPFVEGMAEASGAVQVSGSVTGSLAEPVLAMDLALAGGAFTWLPANVRYENVNLRAQVTDQQVTIERLDLVTRSLARTGSRGLRPAEGPPAPNLVVSGTVALEDFQPGALAASVEAEELWVVDLPDRTARVTGKLAVSGTVDAPSVRGGVSLVQGRLALDDRFFEGVDGNALEPDIHVIRSGELGAADSVAEESGFAGDLDLRIRLERAAELDVVMPTEDYGGALTRGVSEVRLAVTLGDRDGLVVRSRDGTLSVVGEVEPIRGTATVLGREFTLASSGVISFTGLDVTNPILDLEATRDSGGYGTITAAITGTASSPEIALTSDDPRYATTDDAVAILLFGAPLSGDSEAGNLVGMVLSSLMAASVEEAGQILPVDEVRFTSTGISAGKRIGSRVLLTVTFNTSVDETRANLVEVELQLQLPERWFLALTTGTSGFSKAWAFRRWRF